jgi:Domain of unknown function (DUF397)
MSTDPTLWIKASASADTGNCVEMRCHAGAVEVRDTKANGSGPTLGLSKAEFAAWLDGAKRGEFDRLLGD